MKRQSLKLLGLCFLLSLSVGSLSSHKLEQKDSAEGYFVILKQKPVEASQFKAFTKNKMILGEIEKELKLSGGAVLKSYLFAFVGAHVKIDPLSIPNLLKKPEIAAVVKNDQAQLFDKSLFVKSWGLDRIDQRSLPLDLSYNIPYKGKAHVYVVDTGLRVSHKEFVGRVGKGYSAVKDKPSPYEDCNGHGTHVAGTVGGATAGVAVEAIIHPVRVFGCSGGASWNTIIDAIEWVIKNHEKPAVMNMSLGGGANVAIDTAVRNATKAGVHVAVAAGNSNKDSCTYSPARVAEALTVAASDSMDRLAVFSNWGKCVDIIAPGLGINSASHQSDTLYRSLSGTSMSAPHVAGAVALLLGRDANMSTSHLKSFLKSRATSNKIYGVKGSPNLLLYVKDFGTGPIVNAGQDIISDKPISKLVLTGKAAVKEGFIIQAGWTQIAGPRIVNQENSFNTWDEKLVLRHLKPGKYVFRFFAKDNRGGIGFDDVMVWAKAANRPPVVNAGKDKVVILPKSSFYLAGYCYDYDGTCIHTSWSLISTSSPSFYFDPEPTMHGAHNSYLRLSNLKKGVYTFRLTGVDDSQQVRYDDVVVTVK